VLRDKQKPAVYGTGLIALDLVISADEGTPVRAWAGGTCGNILTILSFLGWDAYPISSFGENASSQRLRGDLERWGVHLDLTVGNSTDNVPIIVQEIYRNSEGSPRHRFAWECPNCGHDLPRYKSVSSETIKHIASFMVGPKVFFMDRLSPASIRLARLASEGGALVAYEPSQVPKRDDLEEILGIAHIVKYSDECLSEFEISTLDGCSVQLEIQTLGEKGLRYRFRGNDGDFQWVSMPAFNAPRLTDSCGSGDWCTAGIISRVGAGGKKAFRSLSKGSVRDALNYGQALAAWNCGFEGARGGMYSDSLSTFSSQIVEILGGHRHIRDASPHILDTSSPGNISCPHCDIGSLEVNKS